MNATVADVHRLGELLMDRLLRLEETHSDLCDVGTASDGATVTVEVTFKADGEFVPYSVTYRIAHRGRLFWAMLGRARVACGRTIEELGDAMSTGLERSMFPETMAKSRLVAAKLATPVDIHTA